VKFIVFTIFSVASILGQSFAVSYSLEQLVDSSYAFSGDVKNSTITMEQSYNKNKEIRSRLFPKIVVHGNFTRNMRSYNRFSDESDFSFSSELNGGFSGGSDWGDRYLASLLDERFDMISFGAKRNSAEIGVSVIQPIFHGANGMIDYKISKVESSLLVCHWQEVRMLVKTAIAKQYYQCQLSLKRSQILEKMNDIAQESHSVVKSSFRAGESLPYDTLISFMESVKAEEALFESRQRNALVLYTLQKESGVKQDSGFSVDDSFPILTYELSYETALDRLNQTNKQITTLRGEHDRSLLMIEKAKQQFRPNLQVGADFLRTSHFTVPGAFSMEPERRVYVDFSYDLLATGTRWFSLAQAKQNEQVVQNRLDDTLRERQLELKRCWEDWVMVKARLDRVHSAMEIGKQGIETALEQYRNGVLLRSSLYEIQRKSLELEMSYLDLIYRNNMAVIEIRLLTADYLYN